MKTKAVTLKEQSVTLLHGLFEDDVFKKFKKADYFVCEGRPDLLTSKTTIKALRRKNIIPTVIADNMAGFLFYKNLVKEVRLASQYIDDTGVLCDIGGLILGVLAKAHGIPVYVYPGKMRRRFLAPEEDIRRFNGKLVAPAGTRAYGPLVEWLSKTYITDIL